MQEDLNAQVELAPVIGIDSALDDPGKVLENMPAASLDRFARQARPDAFAAACDEQGVAGVGPADRARYGSAGRRRDGPSSPP
ncbi:hypothetical protein E4N62_09055 [Streptomyces sp. MNU76]|uniref:hypothetical protein n=1 Tax=Streptomyces sp. MNU76 TaxID=2560026 RepID=UPI001E522936|nr:hypothetical protein [Streptomyces sp. MNU76]MCC9705392.1 hypothetical protein [Streptomyces sp. MNU76]